MSVLTARDRAIESLEERELFTLYRRRLGITQVDVQDLAGIRQPIISQWEKNRIELPREKIDLLWEAVESLAATGTRKESGVAGAA